MKVRLLLLICLLNCCYTTLFAQNLFQEMVDSYPGLAYCMDCGDPKASVDPFVLSLISDRINHRYNFGNGAGSIAFQVLVTSASNSCVLSHNDPSHSQLANDLVIALNTCIWKAARENGRPVNSSVNVVFTIANGKISGQIQHLDLEQMKPAGNATVLNKQYQYTNPSLKNYNIRTLTKYNSPVPDNIGINCLVDKTDVLWYATAKGLFRYDGRLFDPVNEYNSPFKSTTEIQDMAVDKDNAKWMTANGGIFMYNTAGWQLFDSVHLNINKPYRVVTAPSGEILLPNNKGLLIFRNGKMRLIDNNLVWQLPSNDVYYAYYDSHERLWIGTSKGSLMIDKKQKVTVFNNTKSPLSNVAVTNVIEDEAGNLYFTLRSCKRPAGSDNDDEGIAIMTADGKWQHYNDKNSGLPTNLVNSLLYDKVEHVLWIATPQAGLIRYDLKGGWENYHNDNSPLLTHDINHLAQDSKGTIYASTANGMLVISRK
jgi:ligand-binding sensor domain-containing protein